MKTKNIYRSVAFALALTLSSQSAFAVGSGSFVTVISEQAYSALKAIGHYFLGGQTGQTEGGDGMNAFDRLNPLSQGVLISLGSIAAVGAIYLNQDWIAHNVLGVRRVHETGERQGMFHLHYVGLPEHNASAVSNRDVLPPSADLTRSVSAGSGALVAEDAR